jgi:SHS2 domain-containing protein
MASAAGGGEFTALPPRDCIRKRTRRPVEQVPIAAAAAAAATTRRDEDEEEEDAQAAAAADGGEEQQEDEQAAAGAAGAARQAAAAEAAAAKRGAKGEAKAGAAKPPAASAAASSPPDLPAYRSCAEQGQKYEYLDHTADVQIHAWGATLEEALENAGLAMFNYMTPLAGVTAPPPTAAAAAGEEEGKEGEEGTENGSSGGFCGRRFVAEAHDADSLVFAFLDELLFAFASDLAVCSELKVTKLERASAGEGGGGAGGGGGEGEGQGGGKWRVEAVGAGERFDRDRHEAGTEIKAITYSAMQVIEKEGDAEIFVIVDI